MSPPHRGGDPVPTGAAAAVEERLALVLDLVGAGDWTWDLDTGLIQCSARTAALLQLPEPGVHPASTVFAALEDDDLEALHGAMADLFAGRTERLDLDCLCRAVEAPRWLRLSVRVVARGPGGEPRSAAGLAIDITGERERERQLTRTRKLDALGRLAAGVAHEINTPLQFVTHNLDFLASEVALATCAGEPRASDVRLMPHAGPAADPIRDAAWWRDIQGAIAESIDGLDRVTTIVRALKQVTHFGSGAPSLVDINTVIESAVTLTRAEWKVVAGVDLQLSPELPPIAAAAVDCGQVFVNLLVNAAHAVGAAHPPGTRGTITVTSRRTDGGVEVRVSDTGSGIPPDVAPRVFESFFTTKSAGHGTGQGLATARAVVERYGGSITFETTLGRGTTFVVGFPAASGIDRAA